MKCKCKLSWPLKQNDSDGHNKTGECRSTGLLKGT